MLFFPQKSRQGKMGGFTLVELLLSIAIISLISSMILAATGSVRAKARDARRTQDMHHIYKLVALAEQNGKYPLADSPVKQAIVIDGQTLYATSADTTDNNVGVFASYVPWADLEAAVGAKLPRDPINVYGTDLYGSHFYTYRIYTDINGRPVNLYFDTATCALHTYPPGIPRQGFILVGHLLEATKGNDGDTLINCASYNADTVRHFSLKFDFL